MWATYLLPVLYDCISSRAVSFGHGLIAQGLRLVAENAVLGVPPVSARGPRQFRAKGTEEEVKGPRENNNIIHVEEKAYYRRAVPNT